MKLLKINIMRGPNYWSNYRKNLIILQLDLEEYKETLSNQIPNFVNNLLLLIPSLAEHHCSLGVAGGFITRLNEGTLLGHIIEHLALELQTLAGMDCGYGRVRETKKPGIYNIVYSYQIERAGLYAGEIALEIVQTLAKNAPYPDLDFQLEKLKRIYANERLGPSTEAVLHEAQSRDIPYRVIEESMILLGYGKHQRMIAPAMGSNTSAISVDIVSDKSLTKRLLLSEYIPMPKGKTIYSTKELNDCISKLGFPLVIKPQYGNHGKGITTDITNKNKALFAFKHAKKISNGIIIERYIKGSDYRFLVINFKLVAVAKRVPPTIIGDGVKTIQALINEINSDPKRGSDHENLLTKVRIDEITQAILTDQGLTLDSILAKDQTLCLKTTANLSTGGTSIDVTDEVDSANVFLAERIARLTNLDICGIDIIAEDHRQPITEKNGAVLEVNASPGLRMHLAPASGLKRNVAKPFIDMLYPNHQTARIPLVAVTGTNGKTTVVRLIAHIAAQQYTVAMTTTEGVYINKHEIVSGDCSGPESAALVLRDSSVEFAVLECARGGILRAGLGFDKCSVSIVTNISEDHIGMDDINDIESLAQVKSVVPHSTLDTGYAILNAEDKYVYAMRDDLHCNIALFSMTKNENILAHAQKGGLCCYIEDGIIFVSHEEQLYKIARVDDIPLSFAGTAICMIKNILPSILAAWASEFKPEIIVKGLMSFLPTADYLPGRMNIFKFPNCEVMLDYAHNEDAYLFLKNYLKNIHGRKKVCIIAGTGDRRHDDIWKTGFYAAQIFDDIIIRHDVDPRGRTHQEITDIITAGIHHFMPQKSIKIIPNEFEAIDYAITHATHDALIWYFPDHITSAVKFLKQKAANFAVKEVS